MTSHIFSNQKLTSIELIFSGRTTKIKSFHAATLSNLDAAGRLNMFFKFQRKSNDSNYIIMAICKSRLLVFIMIFTTNLTSGQIDGFIHPDSIIIGQKKVPKVLLVGSWHFSYPNLDAHQVEDDHRINIYSEKRQKELSELLDYLSHFKPTKIAVESGRNTGYLIKNYQRYKEGTSELYASERSQIGMRLVDRFNLDTIYGVDAYPLLLELRDNKDSLASKTYIDNILEHHYFGGEDEVSKKYSEFYEYKTKMTVEKSLLENFKYINSEKVLSRGFGAYLAGGQFVSERYQGADALSMFWVNRNLRIYRNIQAIDCNENDRILIIFGSGHIPLLKFFIESTPEFELIDFNAIED